MPGPAPCAARDRLSTVKPPPLLLLLGHGGAVLSCAVPCGVPRLPRTDTCPHDSCPNPSLLHSHNAHPPDAVAALIGYEELGAAIHLRQPQTAADWAEVYGAEMAEMRRMLAENAVALPVERFDGTDAELLRFAKACGLLTVRRYACATMPALPQSAHPGAWLLLPQPLPSCAWEDRGQSQTQRSALLCLPCNSPGPLFHLCRRRNPGACRPRRPSSGLQQWRRALAVWCTRGSGLRATASCRIGSCAAGTAWWPGRHTMPVSACGWGVTGWGGLDEGGGGLVAWAANSSCQCSRA